MTQNQMPRISPPQNMNQGDGRTPIDAQNFAQAPPAAENFNPAYTQPPQAIVPANTQYLTPNQAQPSPEDVFHQQQLQQAAVSPMDSFHQEVQPQAAAEAPQPIAQVQHHNQAIMPGPQNPPPPVVQTPHTPESPNPMQPGGNQNMMNHAVTDSIKQAQTVMGLSNAIPMQAPVLQVSENLQVGAYMSNGQVFVYVDATSPTESASLDAKNAAYNYRFNVGMGGAGIEVVHTGAPLPGDTTPPSSFHPDIPVWRSVFRLNNPL